jgi:hypothetical protein
MDSHILCVLCDNADGNIVYVMMNLIPAIIMFFVLPYVEGNKIGNTIMCCIGQLPSAMVTTDGSYWA